MIATNDQRPDALVSRRSSSKGFVGNNGYNTTGKKQTVSDDARPGRSWSVWVKVANDGLALRPSRSAPVPRRPGRRSSTSRAGST